VDKRDYTKKPRGFRYDQNFLQGFDQFLGFLLEEEKNWFLVRDRYLTFKNYYNEETTKRQITIGDSFGDKIHISIFKNLTAYIEMPKVKNKAEADRMINKLDNIILASIEGAEAMEMDLDDMARQWGYQDWDHYYNCND
jgi:hypothetical protein